jgi:hypothetical protein
VLAYLNLAGIGHSTHRNFCLDSRCKSKSKLLVDGGSAVGKTVSLCKSEVLKWRADDDQCAGDLEIQRLYEVYLALLKEAVSRCHRPRGVAYSLAMTGLDPSRISPQLQQRYLETAAVLEPQWNTGEINYAVGARLLLPALRRNAAVPLV